MVKRSEDGGLVLGGKVSSFEARVPGVSTCLLATYEKLVWGVGRGR